MYSHFNKTQRIQTVGSLFLLNSLNDSEFNDQMVENVHKASLNEARTDDVEFSYLFERMYFFLGLSWADLGSLAELSRSEALRELGENFFCLRTTQEGEEK